MKKKLINSQLTNIKTYLMYREEMLTLAENVFKFKKKKIENDMLRAIIIMNNAFKSGKSTIQAVEIASEKLSKPISSEFKRMHQEMISLQCQKMRKIRKVHQYIFAKEKVYPIFQDVGIKVIFYLLQDKNNIDKTYREIQENTGVALGTVKNVIDELVARNFILVTDKG